MFKIELVKYLVWISDQPEVNHSKLAQVQPITLKITHQADCSGFDYFKFLEDSTTSSAWYRKEFRRRRWLQRRCFFLVLFCFTCLHNMHTPQVSPIIEYDREQLLHIISSYAEISPADQTQPGLDHFPDGYNALPPLLYGQP